MENNLKRLYRSRDERMLSGVCGGLGKFLSTDPTIVRLAIVFITMSWPFMLLVYLALLVTLEEEPMDQSIKDPDIESSGV